MNNIGIHKWNKENSMNDIRDAVYNLYAGNVEYKGPDSNRIIKVYTSDSGIEIVNKMLVEQATSTGFVLSVEDQDEMKNTGKFTKITIPFLGNLIFEVNNILESKEESALFIITTNQ